MACSRPISVPSQNIMLFDIPGVRFAKNPAGYNKLNPIGPDCSFIPVGCGICPDCLRLRQIYCVQRAQMEVFAGCDLFFFTLTVQDSMMKRVRIGDKVYKYADYRDVALMMKRIKKGNLFGFDFEFMVVREMGGEKGRHHFHGIISMIPFEKNERKSIKISRGIEVHNILLKEWRRNVSGSSRWPVWKPMSRYVVDSRGRRTFDCHYVDPALTPNSEGDVAFYITKYCLKPNKKIENLRSFLKINFPQDYFDYWKHLSPRVWYSRKFGQRYDIAFEKHIRKGIDFAIRENMLSLIHI